VVGALILLIFQSLFPKWAADGGPTFDGISTTTWQAPGVVVLLPPNPGFRPFHTGLEPS
jgi:hypothetical protein